MSLSQPLLGVQKVIKPGGNTSCTALHRQEALTCPPAPCTLRTYGATLTHLKRVKDKLKPEYKYLMNLRLKAISPAVPGQRVNTPSYMDDLICVTHILNRCSAPFLLALRLIQLLQQTSSAPLESASPPVQSCKAMMRQLGICQTLLWSVLQRT